jgi:2-polyprenyl-3-methyl-5-hydroxy-6-metoxy-1,4-benzoquinol methylase
LYGEAYFSGDGSGYGDYASQETEYRATFAADLKRIACFVSSGSILDVGCGYGWFVSEALAAGYDAYGVDLSEYAVTVASETLGGRVYHGTPADVVELSGRRFDVIFASHVVEHVTNPRLFVADLEGRLTERGILVLVTPNLRSWLARISGRRWVSLKVPEHVAYYTPDTISRLLEGEGLRVIDIAPAYQFYRLPFVAKRIRELIRPIGGVIPAIERLPRLRDQLVRIPSGSIRVIASSSAGGPG